MLTLARFVFPPFPNASYCYLIGSATIKMISTSSLFSHTISNCSNLQLFNPKENN